MKVFFKKQIYFLKMILITLLETERYKLLMNLQVELWQIDVGVTDYIKQLRQKNEFQSRKDQKHLDL